MLLNYVPLFLFLASSLPQKINQLSSQSLLSDIFTFLSLTPPSSLDLRDTPSMSPVYDSQPLYRCVQLRFSFVAGSLGQKLDSGRGACGWVVEEISAKCLGSRLHDLRFVTRNVVAPEEKKTSPPLRTKPKIEMLATSRPLNPSTPQPLNTSTPQPINTEGLGGELQTILIPIDGFVRRVTLVWRSDVRSRYLTAIRMTLSDGSTPNITCSEVSQSTETISFSNLERINGFYASFDVSQISDLDLFYHRAARDWSRTSESTRRSSAPSKRVASARSDYNRIVQSNLITGNRLEDQLEVRGPFGELSGEKFRDQVVFGHWNVAEVRAWAVEDGITGLQLLMRSHFAATEKAMGLLGKKIGEEQLLRVPEGKFLALVETFLSGGLKPCALRLSLNTGELLGVLGNWSCLYTGRPSTFLLSDRENLIGLTGFSDDKGIKAIGFVLLVRYGDEFLNL